MQHAARCGMRPTYTCKSHATSYHCCTSRVARRERWAFADMCSLSVTWRIVLLLRLSQSSTLDVFGREIMV